MPEKEQELIDQLLDKSKTRLISWEPTAERDEFTATFRGKNSFTIAMSYDSWNKENIFTLTMRDSEDRDMLSIDTNTPGINTYTLSDLFEAARRSGLNVDKALDDVLDDLKKRG